MVRSPLVPIVTPTYILLQPVWNRTSNGSMFVPVFRNILFPFLYSFPWVWGMDSRTTQGTCSQDAGPTRQSLFASSVRRAGGCYSHVLTSSLTSARGPASQHSALRVCTGAGKALTRDPRAAPFVELGPGAWKRQCTNGPAA
uniref:Uncharacterized protein n=1 Tax=Molossus molossus TaxID=27622 RepID=A0A7J8GKG2_MOLMO|nr:hypothetical protein HJG59_011476 [Molossus molossus]